MIFSEQERKLIADTEFFPAKAAVIDKVNAMLLQLRDELRGELSSMMLMAPEGIDVEQGQLVKGEHLLDFPYQYLDFPKYFSQGEMCTFRTLVWWGHHVTFALILGGSYLDQYKANFLALYDELADRDFSLLMTETPWEWRRGEEFLLPITRKGRPQVEAALKERPFLKIHRVLEFDHPSMGSGTLVDEGRATFRRLALIAAP